MAKPNAYGNPGTPGISAVNSPTIGGGPSGATRVSSLLQDFEKGIRRDKSAYLILKDDKEWDNWRRSTIATARTLKCAEVFDADYIPHSAEDKASFRQKQLFMYSVFDEKLQTDMGKNLYDHTRQGQTLRRSTPSWRNMLPCPPGQTSKARPPRISLTGELLLRNSMDRPPISVRSSPSTPRSLSTT